MKDVIQKLFDSAKLQKSEREQLDRLLERPEVQEVLSRDEQDTIAKRKAMIREIAEINKAIPAKVLAVEKAAIEANKRLEKIEREYLLAKEEVRLILLKGNYVEYPDNLKKKSLEDDLRRGSDKRIFDFRFHVSALLEQARHKTETTIVRKKTAFGGYVDAYSSNRDDVSAAVEAALAAINELEAMRLDAISHTEVTARLTGISSRLEPVLWKLKLHPPRMSSKGDVKPPFNEGFPIPDSTKQAIVDAA